MKHRPPLSISLRRRGLPQCRCPPKVKRRVGQEAHTTAGREAGATHALLLPVRDQVLLLLFHVHILGVDYAAVFLLFGVRLGTGFACGRCAGRSGSGVGFVEDLG